MSEARTKKQQVHKQIKQSQSEIEINQPYPMKLFNTMNKNKHKVPLPNISADAWCVVDMDSGGQLLFGKRASHKREIASLTKMMTFFVAWQ